MAKEYDLSLFREMQEFIEQEKRESELRKEQTKAEADSDAEPESPDDEIPDAPALESGPAADITPVDDMVREQPNQDIEGQLYGVKALLVEDIGINRDLICGILKGAGAAVSVAVDGIDAVGRVRAARRGDINIILMDLQMPKMNGYEAAEQIRRLEKGKGTRIPILAVSADISSELKNMLRAGTFDGYINKPINVENLIHTIKVTLGER